ncbi:kunitz-type serine protease inhibitor PIVL [Drosophila novamexicana]|uniref:kunitz-type serine protease inhibitor PIVL n=1 Tax=Drosophila novamexicana TaxID=47314 RepID=UPI0011E5EB28|nr:kunitz-type serine protease inhibitor PIVL [Drosophila novamexicana]
MPSKHRTDKAHFFCTSSDVGSYMYFGLYSADVVSSSCSLIANMKYEYLLPTAIGLLLCLASVHAKPEMCNEQHSMSGMAQDGAACMAYMPSWTYDAAKNACVEFVFGGCGGNKNQFGSKGECETACKD